MILLNIFADFLDIFLHLDKHMEHIVTEYQTLTYAILFLIVFCETGLIVTPFLPGDSLLFAAGAIAAKTGILSVWVIIPLLFCAALLGDNVNYFVGSRLGKKVFDMDTKLFKKEYLERTQQFFAKHGGKTLIYARFVPIIRTFTPFVAGVSEMTYQKFIVNCLAGAAIWVTLLTLAGYFFGQIPFVKNNFELVVLGIIGVSLLPVLVQLVQNKSQK
jgi:membrane-associated protein